MKIFSLRNYKWPLMATVVAAAGILNAQAQSPGSSQVWTGITPPPANGTAWSFSQLANGVWDGTANWANSAPTDPVTVTDYFALTAGAGRTAIFLPKTGGYTVTIADDYTPPTIRALQVSGGNPGGSVTIQSNVAKTITLQTNNTAFIAVDAGKELVIGPNVTFAVTGTGASSITKLSAGTLRWSGAAAAYNNAIQVTVGTFIIDSDASSRLSSSSTVNITGGEFRYNGASALTSAVSLTSGKISGSGHITSAISVGANSIIAPGNNAIGTQQYDDLTFAASGTYQWEIGSWLGEIAGVDFDQIQADDFAVSSTLETPFVLSLTSVGGALSDFDASLDRKWTVLEASSPISAEVLNRFSINSTAFAALNPLNDGVFSLEVDGESLNLVFTRAVPEPSSFLLLLIGLAACAIAKARRQAASR